MLSTCISTLYLNIFFAVAGLTGGVLRESSEHTLAGEGVSSLTSSGSGTTSIMAGGIFSTSSVQPDALNKERLALVAVSGATSASAHEEPSKL
jgi:hypothetical protein